MPQNTLKLPIQAVTEAIVNAVAHRDYTSNASIQVMLFKDRLEICNPGSLPYGLTTAKLLLPHNSMPANPLLAEPMYLRGTIESMGTGTGDIVKRCVEMGLPAPVYLQEDDFRVVLYRAVSETAQETAQETLLNNTKIIALLNGIGKKQLSLKEMLVFMQLKHAKNFKIGYLTPAIQQGYVALLYPDNPTHRNQRYYLTDKGLQALK
jgi:ATP-dependent DNA helicase RecG